MKTKWISVVERLPYIHEDVLIAVKWRGGEAKIDTSWVDDEGEWQMGSAKPENYEITHWMPLPEPPK